MTPPSAPKEDASWLQLKEYEVYCKIFLLIKYKLINIILDNITKSRCTFSIENRNS